MTNYDEIDFSPLTALTGDEVIKHHLPAALLTGKTCLRGGQVAAVLGLAARRARYARERQ